MEQIINYIYINSFIAGLIVIFMGGFCSIFLPEKIKTSVFTFSLGISAVLILIPVVKILTGFADKYEYIIHFANPLGTCALLIDSISGFFILIITIISFFSSIYCIGYIKHYFNKNYNVGLHLFFLSILIISMILVTAAHNVLFFLIVWELMSISSFFLVYFENDNKEVVKASINYLVYMHIGFLLLLTGFVLTSINSGSGDFASFKGNISQTAFILFFIGFGIKAGMMPFHSWLPHAHSSAPTHVSAIMSAVMIKTGIYGILRIISLMDNKINAWISYMVLIIGIISAVLGILFSLNEKDIKKILAYSSVENIGVILTSLGVGLLGITYNNVHVSFIGFTGAFLHILNHSLFKSILFYSAGSVYLSTHTRNIEKLGGLAQKMPALTFLTFIGVLAISAIPPFNGFIGKFIIYFGLFKLTLIEEPVIFFVSIISVALMAFVGGLCLLSFTRLMSVAFLGQSRSKEASDAVKPSIVLIIPMIFLTIAVIAIGFLPNYTLLLLQKPAMAFADDQFITGSLTGLVKNISFVFFLLMGVFLFLILIKFILSYKKIKVNSTWGCGYKNISPKIQYTADSYSREYSGLLKLFFKKKNQGDLPETLELFPKQHELKTKTVENIEYYIIKPAFRMILKVIDWFSWIQSGNMQQYILYGLLFLIAVIIWAIYF